jgi:hypothetical protein
LFHSSGNKEDKKERRLGNNTEGTTNHKQIERPFILFLVELLDSLVYLITNVSAALSSIRLLRWSGNVSSVDVACSYLLLALFG